MIYPIHARECSLEENQECHKWEESPPATHTLLSCLPEEAMMLGYIMNPLTVGRLLCKGLVIATDT